MRSFLLVLRSKAVGVVEGYLINDEMKYYVQYYWYCINEQNYDAGTVINMILMPDVFQKLGKRRLSQTPPDGYKYISIMNLRELKNSKKDIDFIIAILKCSGKTHQVGCEGLLNLRKSTKTNTLFNTISWY